MSQDPSARWLRTQELFHAALEMPPDRRGAFLERACRNDPAMLDELRALLGADEAPGAIDAIVEGELAGLAADEAHRPGKRVGPYRLVSPLAEGGMGVVWLGERADEQYEKRVAIKLIRGVLVDESLRRHFLDERQNLARLEHANIARLLDGGSTDDGQPYLVMDYVEGEPLDAWCRRRGPGLQQRLALFRKVCAAVHYAHQQMVIHCDLKTSNILVTPAGEPVLVDFGVSRLLDGQGRSVPGGEAGPPNRLTLRYSSPEQVQGRPVSAGTDIYALGVILYELLTGCTPYGVSPGDAPAYADAIVREAPIPPSRAELGAPPATPWYSAATGRRALRGDLDAIVLLALSKAPEQRYPSAARLAEDIGSYLARRPINARPYSSVYRAGKFIARNPFGSTLALLLTLSAVAFGAVVVQKNREVTAERDAAQVERLKAEAVTDFLVQMFNEASPDNARGRDVTVAEVLERAGEKLAAGDAEQIREQPAVEATVRRAIARVYLTLGLPEQAAPHIERTLEVLEGLGLTRTEDYLLALQEHARLLGIEFRHAEAREVEARALELAETLYGPEHPRTLDVLEGLAIGYHMTGELEPAKMLFTRVHEARTRVHGPEHDQTLGSLRNLAVIDYWLGQYDEAEPLYRQCVELGERLHGETHLVTMRCMSDLGSLLETTGRYAEAEPVIARHAALAGRVLGPRHPDTLRSLHNLADAWRGLGRFENAERLFRDVLERRREVLGEEHIETLQTQVKLARLYRLWGRLAQAGPLVEGALAAQTRALGFEHPTTLVAAQEAADLALARGDAADATARYEQVLDGRTRALGPDHPDLVGTLAGLAQARLRAGEGEAAQAAMARAEALAAANPGVRVAGFEAALAEYRALQASTRGAVETGSGN